MADVFISYCSADRARVGEIAQALEKEGLRVWWDRALVAGDRYEAEIDAALAGAKAVIVVWSPASAVSDWVRSESDEARRAGKLIPVLIEQCRVPRPFDRLHTIDMANWRGDRGNDGFPELVEAVKARTEGRAARPIPWRLRLTFVAVATAITGAIVTLSAFVGLIDVAVRWNGAFAAQSAERLSAGEAAPPETQAGFRNALAELSRVIDRRTQRALTTLERGSREEALAALQSLAEDQGQAVEGQMQRTAALWRQIGLLRFSEDANAARIAFEKARRYAPDDPTILTPLGALYQREGRIADADEVYRRVLSLGALSRWDEGRVRQVLGQAALERSEVEAAEREFLKALELAQAGGDEELEADLYIDFGLVELERSNYPGAHAYFTTGRDFARSLDYAASVAYADFNEVETFIAEGRTREAEALLRETQEYAQSIGDNYLALFRDLSMSKIAARTGDARRALSIAQTVEARARAQGMRRATLEAQTQRAEDLLLLDRAAQAEQAAHAAAEGWRQMRAAGSMAIASALEAAAMSRQPARAEQGCRSLALSAAAASGYTQREVARIRRFAICPARAQP